MGSALSDRSEEEKRRNLERFTPLLYQLTKSGESTSMVHSMKCDIIGQEPGAYPYPVENRISSNETSSGEEETVEIEIPPPCFKAKKLL